MYALAQCIQDMPYERCAACLDDIISDKQSSISAGQMGAAFLGVWCTLRYETDTQFFTDTKILLLNAVPRSRFSLNGSIDFLTELSSSVYHSSS